MAANVVVSVSGPALSLLTFENSQSLGDQSGFLLGTIVKHVTNTINDSQICNEKMETIISINAPMPIPNSICIHTSSGKINKDILYEFLGDKRKEVVGWYKFRRCSPLIPSLREKMFHKDLCEHLPHITSDDLAMCLLSSNVTNGGSTHSFNHRYLCYKESAFQSLPVQIHNLGETCHSEYKLIPSTSCISDSFHDIITEVRNRYEGILAPDMVQRIQAEVQSNLCKVIVDLNSIEKELCDEMLELEASEMEIEAKKLSLQPTNEPVSVNEDDVGAMEVCKDSSPILSSPDACDSSEKNDVSLIEPVQRNNTNEPVDMETDPDTSHGSADPFAYVEEEMKLEMSKSKNPPSPTVGDNNSPKVSDRGKGVTRGVGRGRGKQVAVIAENPRALRSHNNIQAVNDNSSPRIRNVDTQAQKKSLNTQASPRNFNNKSQTSPIIPKKQV